MKYGYDFYFYNQRPESFLVVEFTLPWLRNVPTQISDCFQVNMCFQVNSYPENGGEILKDRKFEK